MVANGDAGRIFQDTGIGIEQAPVPADGPLPLTLPGLVVGFDQIDAKVLSLRDSENIGNAARLVGPRGKRALAHSPLTRPTGLAHKKILSRERGRPLLAFSRGRRRRRRS